MHGARSDPRRASDDSFRVCHADHSGRRNPGRRKHGCTIACMEANSCIALALPSLELSLAHVSDDEVLARTRRLVGRSNLLTAELLVHLAEVEERGIHRTRACSSLYAYCIYELRFS